MQFALEKRVKVTSEPFLGSLVMSKNIALGIYIKIIELEHNKSYRYLEINEVNGIDYMINKKKKRILWEKRIECKRKL